MSKVSVVYWSQSGNTQAMAEAVGKGVICQETPDADAIAACEALGKALAAV